MDSNQQNHNLTEPLTEPSGSITQDTKDFTISITNSDVKRSLGKEIDEKEQISTDVTLGINELPTNSSSPKKAQKVRTPNRVKPLNLVRITVDELKAFVEQNNKDIQKLDRVIKQVEEELDAFKYAQNQRYYVKLQTKMHLLAEYQELVQENNLVLKQIRNQENSDGGENLEIIEKRRAYLSRNSRRKRGAVAESKKKRGVDKFLMAENSGMVITPEMNTIYSENDMYEGGSEEKSKEPKSPKKGKKKLSADYHYTVGTLSDQKPGFFPSFCACLRNCLISLD